MKLFGKKRKPHSVLFHEMVSRVAGMHASFHPFPEVKLGSYGRLDRYKRFHVEGNVFEDFPELAAVAKPTLPENERVEEDFFYIAERNNKAAGSVEGHITAKQIFEINQELTWSFKSAKTAVLVIRKPVYVSIEYDLALCSSLEEKVANGEWRMSKSDKVCTTLCKCVSYALLMTDVRDCRASINLEASIEGIGSMAPPVGAKAEEKWVHHSSSGQWKVGSYKEGHYQYSPLLMFTDLPKRPWKLFAKNPPLPRPLRLTSPAIVGSPPPYRSAPQSPTRGALHQRRRERNRKVASSMSLTAKEKLLGIHPSSPSHPLASRYHDVAALTDSLNETAEVYRGFNHSDVLEDLQGEDGSDYMTASSAIHDSDDDDDLPSLIGDDLSSPALKSFASGSSQFSQPPTPVAPRMKRARESDSSAPDQVVPYKKVRG